MLSDHPMPNVTLIQVKIHVIMNLHTYNCVGDGKNGHGILRTAYLGLRPASK